ncbi:MAG: hypothetical protein OXH41_08250 [Chloroflexi bacterium]|nr:hypothetical protein [Chloroflexota bacterium]
MALTFNSREAVQKLLGRGLPEPAADGIVEVVEEATSEVVTRDILRAELQVVRTEMAEFRAEFYRAALIQGGVIIGAVVALVKLL